MRRTPFLPAAMLGLTLLVPASVQAVGETCQGQPATHVGTPDGDTLTGTEGPDVILSNGSRVVEALGGDDLVCVTSSTNEVFTGAGNDVVQALEVQDFATQVELGPGSDRYTGSAGHDAVWGGSMSGRVHDDVERDVIDAGSAPGDYDDLITSGQPRRTNADEVHLVGGTLLFRGTPTSQTVLTGGGGARLDVITSGVRSVAIDTVAGTFGQDDATASFTGFDTLVVSDASGPRSVTFRGSDRSETLTMDLTRNPAYDVDMGDGDDEVVLETDRIHRRVTTVEGGAGRDRLGIVMQVRRDVALDLRRGRLLAGRPDRAVPAEATGFEDATVVAHRVHLRGTGRDNDLRAAACSATVRALGGDDVLSPVTPLYVGQLSCRTMRARLEGGRGADVLRGTSGPDLLLGGRGRDLAVGGPDRDVCRAETTRRCEARR